MKVGIPREVKNHEYRVAITPSGVNELVRSGHDVLVETDAGVGSSITDADFVAAEEAGRLAERAGAALARADGADWYEENGTAIDEAAFALARLRRAMGDSARSGQVVAVTGEAGAGKTSLLRAATSTPTGGRVVRGLCDPLATPRPLGPVRDILAELGVDQPPGTPGRGDVEALLVTAVSTAPTGSTGRRR